MKLFNLLNLCSIAAILVEGEEVDTWTVTVRLLNGDEYARTELTIGGRDLLIQEVQNAYAFAVAQPGQSIKNMDSL